MDEKLAALAGAQGGVILSSQALAGGLTAEDLRTLVARRDWLALRRGMYVDAATVEEMDRTARHRVDVAAAILSYEGRLVAPQGAQQRLLAGHRSAALLWQLPAPDLVPVPRPSPSVRPKEPTTLLTRCTIELICTDRGRRATRYGVRMRPAAVPDAHVAVLDGIPVTSRARTAVDLARLGTFREGVLAGDAALRDGATKAELESVAKFCRLWPGGPQAVRVAEFCDGRAQSVAESLARVILHENGIGTTIDVQVPLDDARGKVIYVLDIVVDGRVDIEVDGKIKYVDPWAVPGEVMWKEKLREDAIRDRGYEVVRTTWDELLHRPADFIAKVRRALARARPAGMILRPQAATHPPLSSETEEKRVRRTPPRSP